MDLILRTMPSQVRIQWERALRHSGRRSFAWSEAVSWERRVSGDAGTCRKLFNRGLKEVEDLPEVQQNKTYKHTNKQTIIVCDENRMHPPRSTLIRLSQ